MAGVVTYRGDNPTLREAYRGDNPSVRRFPSRPPSRGPPGGYPPYSGSSTITLRPGQNATTESIPVHIRDNIFSLRADVEIGSEEHRIETEKYCKKVADLRGKKSSGIEVKSAEIEVKSAEIEVKQRKKLFLENRPTEKSYTKDAQAQERAQRLLRNQELRTEEEEEYIGKRAKSKKKRAQGGGNRKP